MWWTKSRRAQNVDDYETWISGGVVPTLNVFDNASETRATVLIVSIDFYNASIDERNFHTLRVGGANEGKPGVLIIDGTRVNDVRVYEDGIVPTVISRYGTGGGNVPMVFSHTQGLDVQASEENSPTLRAGGAGMAVSTKQTVRRLTPVECERLQGFPDDWTSGQADSNRYKQMGNAVAVPVVEWIVGRLVAQLSE
jgi:site-specific DNA-cytosine methylase